MFGESLRLSPSEPVTLHELQKQAQERATPLSGFVGERVDEGLLDRGIGLAGSEAHDLARSTLPHLLGIRESVGQRRAVGERQGLPIELNAATGVDRAPRFAATQMTCGVEV